MDDEHNRYPALSRRQVALFERNPVCELCFRVCLDLSEEYGGGIHFELFQSLEVADSFCERVLLNPWDLLDIDQYYHWLERQLDNSKPAVTCAFATISVTLSCMDGLPEPVLQLSRDIRGLISGGQGGELYDNLRSAARNKDLLIPADTYGDIPPQPDLQRELEQFKNAYTQAASEILTLKKQLQMKEQQDEPKVVYQFNGPYIKENHVEAGGNQILSAENVYLPGAEKVSIDSAASLSAASDNRPKKESRLKQLFEDPQLTSEESNRFLNFLTDHNISSRLIDSSQDNPILKAVVCFCVKWRNLRYIEPQYSPSAVLRFLTDTCSLQTDRVADRAIANALGVMIKNGYDKVMYEDVCDYF